MCPCHTVAYLGRFCPEFSTALGLGVLLGAQFGARFSHHVHGQWSLRSLAVALGLVGIRILVLTFV